MESMNARTNEIEEITVVEEVEEASESSNAGSLFAGVIGGFLAYAAISGLKKLRVIIAAKRAQKNAEIIDTDNRVVADDAEEAQSDS